MDPCTRSPIAPQFPCFAPGSESNAAIGVDGLPAGVLLTGTPTITEVDSSDLTITQEAVNASARTIYGQSYAPGTAILFHREGGVAGRDYTLQVSVGTDASPADVLVGYVRFRVLRAPARGIPT